ncbi:hypothetical protein ACFFX0_00920 [Citricoccus parietis]|uniref:Uncharacterized protein n=1 Tax=Citricoccus parietis TaxID=592307 RepID=A0ABV5FT36_9MICC
MADCTCRFSETSSAISRLTGTGSKGVRARWRLTSNGVHRHSSRSRARSKGAITPMPRWVTGPSKSMSDRSTAAPALCHVELPRRSAELMMG